LEYVVAQHVSLPRYRLISDIAGQQFERR